MNIRAVLGARAAHSGHTLKHLAVVYAVLDSGDVAEAASGFA
jgi:hypothetical protein